MEYFVFLFTFHILNHSNMVLLILFHWFVVVQSLSPTLCDLMDYHMPDFSVFCYLPEIAQEQLIAQICGITNSMDMSWWWTGRPGMGLQRVGHDWVTELNWTELSQWYHPTISFFVALFSSCLQSFPTSGSFPMSQFFTLGGQNTGASSSASVLPMNIHGWFLLGLTDLISLLFKRLSRVFSSTTVWKHKFLSTQIFLWSYSHICTWLLEKP